MQRNYAKYNISVSKAVRELHHIIEQNEITAILKKSSIQAYIIPVKRFNELMKQLEESENSPKS